MQSNKSGSDPSAGGGLTRVFLALLGAVVLVCFGVASWRINSQPEGDSAAGRTYTIWQASDAIATFVHLQRAAATGGDPENVGTLARKFAQTVTRTRQAASSRPDPAVYALIDRLEAVRKRLTALESQSPDLTVTYAGSADDLAELTRLAEAANQENAVLTKREANAADDRRWLVVALLGVLATTGLVLIVVLDRNVRQSRTVHFVLHGTQARLRDAEEAAARVETAKSHFLAAATHDLRAPMEAVMSLTELLMEEELLPSQRATAVRIRDVASNMPRVLDDARDYAGLEAGELATEERPFSPEALTKATVLAIDSQARAKNLTIVSTPGPGLPRFLLGDPERIGRVLYRLANNAVRFTREGGVSLQVLSVERSPGHATVEWIVSDTGVGIDQARLDRLRGTEGAEGDWHGGPGKGALAKGYADWSRQDVNDPENGALENISRENGPRKNGQPASGQPASELGLALCRRLVARMGGGMTFESAIGEGTRIRVRLPFKIAAARMARAPASPSAAPLRDCLQAMGRRPKLLMAEDTPAGQFILRQLLAREGIAPEMVADGRAAVRAAEANHYDVICMDLRMPEMDGLEATRRIRAGRGPSARTPIIAVTASTTPADVQACRDAGMTMFVAKPVGRETLLNAILTALTDDQGHDPFVATNTRQPVH